MFKSNCREEFALMFLLEARYCSSTNQAPSNCTLFALKKANIPTQVIFFTSAEKFYPLPRQRLRVSAAFLAAAERLPLEVRPLKACERA